MNIFPSTDCDSLVYLKENYFLLLDWNQSHWLQSHFILFLFCFSSAFSVFVLTSFYLQVLTNKQAEPEQEQDKCLFSIYCCYPDLNFSWSVIWCFCKKNLSGLIAGWSWLEALGLKAPRLSWQICRLLCAADVCADPAVYLLSFVTHFIFLFIRIYTTYRIDFPIFMDSLFCSVLWAGLVLCSLLKFKRFCFSFQFSL